MRGRKPDALTPREQQVLDLLKRGYSNRDIAQELGISLPGAKYHVSEIISKLGVSSRDEAAAWQPRTEKRWGFTPVLLSGRLGWLHALPLKLTLGAVAASVIALGAFIAFGGTPGGDNPSATAPEPTPTPDFPCPTPSANRIDSCIRLVHIELASWEEARPKASWQILEPQYIPSGYERERLTYSYTEPPTTNYAVHTSAVSATFRAPDGTRLTVTQGYWATFDFGAYDRAPEEYRGSVFVAGREMRWVNGGAVWEERSDGGHVTDVWDVDSLGRYRLTWEEPKDGPLVWEKSPDGEISYYHGGQSLGFAVYSTSLPLEELIKVAESMLTN